MKKYPKYKDSGVEWLDAMPEHWVMTRANALFQHLKNSISIEQLKKIRILIHYSIPSIQEFGIGQIEDGETIDSNKFKIAGGEILVSKLNPRKGTVAIVEKSELPMVCSTEFVILQPRNIDVKFSYYLYSSHLLTEQIASRVFSVTNSHQRANPADISKIWLSVPANIDEQNTIATYLDQATARLDRFIALRQQQCNLLKEQRAALIQQAVTKGIRPGVTMKDTGVEWIGEVPEGWAVVKLKFLLYAIKGGGTPSTENQDFWDGGIPWVSPKDMKSETIEVTQDTITELAIQSSATEMVPQDSILIVVRSGILKHTFPVALNTVQVALNQDLKALLVDDKKIKTWFLFRLLKGFQNAILTFCTKVGATVDSVEMPLLENFYLPIPSISEQQEIIDYITHETAELDLLTQKYQRQIELVREYRTSLIAAAVTGKIDVRGNQN